MRYYIVADPHGYYTYLEQTLRVKGFFEDKEPHKLIICGDIFDRGSEAKKIQEFVLDLMKKRPNYSYKRQQRRPCDRIC